MEKRKVFAVIMSAILALSLTACGAVTVTTAQSEPQPAAEVETPTPTPVEEPEVTPEPTKEPEVEEVVEEPATEEPEVEESTEELEITVEEPKEMTPMEALLNSNMSEYIAGGVFDDVKFGEDASATEVRIGKHSSTFVYEGWFIQLGNSGDSHPDIGYVLVGIGNFATGEGVAAKYSYLFPNGNDIDISGVDETDGISVPVECIIHLQDLVNFVKENGVDVVPDVPGTNFRPCDPADETIQY